MTGFSMDTLGFLQSINKLERRFEELVSPGALRKALDDWQSREVLDHRLYELAHRIFANTGWSMTICVAAASFDGELIGQCQNFIHGCASTVRTYGMGVWLYDLLNNAAVAMLTGEPSERTPLYITMVHASDLPKRSRMRGPRRFGSSRDQRFAISEHCRQMSRLAAYTMLRWGDGGERCLATARMLLHEPGIGMCMLREDPQVLEIGAVPDMNFRRVVKYLEMLHARADEEFAQESSAASGQLNHEEYYTDVDYAQADARYLYDARKLIEAYRDLWEQQTPKATEMLQAIEQDGMHDCSGMSEDDSVWRDVVYLRAVSQTLLGSGLGADLIVGFEERDTKRFDRGVAFLEGLSHVVEENGLLLLPITLLDERVGFTGLMPQSSAKQRESKMQSVAEIGECMASIVMVRFPHRDVARQCALTMLDCEVGSYATIVQPLVRDDDATKVRA